MNSFRMDQANGEIYSNRTASKSLHGELGKVQTDLLQSKTRECQLEGQLDIAKRDLNEFRNAFNQLKGVFQHHTFFNLSSLLQLGLYIT